MVLWTYATVVLTDPGGVPLNWRPLREEEKGDADPLVGLGYGIGKIGTNQSTVPDYLKNLDIGFCLKCNRLKPPRAHHCSICEKSRYILLVVTLLINNNERTLVYYFISGNRCILKMDHHCGWVANCVGVLNYKSFLLFLVC